MPTRVGSTTGLRDADTRSLAPAYAAIIKSLAGRVRYLYELGVGQSGVDGEEPCTPKNPQGLYGLDFSGPPWGSALRHPLFGRGGVKEDVSGNWEGQRQVGSVVKGSPLAVPIVAYVRPFAARERAPYSRAYVALRAYQSAAVAAFNVTVRCRDPLRTYAREETISVASVNEGNFKLSTAFFDLVPGMNNLVLEFETTSTTAALISCFEGFQNSKRGY